MRLILTDARPAHEFFRGGTAFLVPDYHCDPDQTIDIIIEGVNSFRSEHFGFLVNFKQSNLAQLCHAKTGWVQDTAYPPPDTMLYGQYDFNQRCFYVGEIAYMSYRLEEEE